MAERWYHDSSLLRSFGTALINAEVLEDLEDVLAFFQHPQRYNQFYMEWENAGFPNEGDDNWDEFVDSISESEDSEEEEEDA
jgi:hypothetical protein